MKYLPIVWCAFVAVTGAYADAHLVTALGLGLGAAYLWDLANRGSDKGPDRGPE